jgi:acyl-CoA synthetase (AMP-forming)/AMP-acid ligase II/acyl carrier protein
MSTADRVSVPVNEYEYTFDLPAYASLNAVLRKNFAERRQQVAFTFNHGDGEPERYSHERFEASVLALASELARRQLAGSRALLLFNPGYDYIVAFFGCLFAGVIAVPAFPPLTNRDWPRLLKIVEDCSAETILTSSYLKSSIYDWISANETRSMACLSVDQLDCVAGNESLPDDIGHDTIAFLQYTSGSTGNPKGVMVTHGNLLHNCAAILQAMDCNADSIGASWLPPYHDMGLIGGIISPLLAGFPVHLMSPLTFLKRPMTWLQTISRERVTATAGPNFAYEYCVRRVSAKEVATLDLSSLKVAGNGAEPIKAASLRLFAEHFAPAGFSPKAFLPCYGLAEATLMVAGLAAAEEPRIVEADADEIARQRFLPPRDDSRRIALVTAGRCVAGTEAFIVDPVTMTEVADGGIGEIWVRGPGIARGYWQRGQETSDTFGACFNSRTRGLVGPCMRTGDLGFWHDGHLVITGRAKEIVIIRGRNYYPQDIEWIVQQQSDIFRSSSGAAFSIEGGDGEALVVVQEISRAAHKRLEDPVVFNALVQSINQALSEQLGIQLQVLALIEQGSLLKTSSGKIQRVGMRQAWLDGALAIVRQWQRSEPARPHHAAGTEHAPADFMHADYALTQLLVQWVAEALAVPTSEIDIDLPFSALGLDSVQGVEIAARLEKHLGQTLPPTLLFRYPTINDLVAFINNSSHKVKTAEESQEFDELDALSREDLIDRLRAELDNSV